jgi:predicted esterase
VAGPNQASELCTATIAHPSYLLVDRERTWDMRGFQRAVLLASSILLAVLQPCLGQTPEGRLQERITSASDTTQAYALYTPPGYPSDRRWPILFVLDPRGRALPALKLFEDAAARLGWIIMSSYNTRSDGPAEPNLNAMDAMLRSAQESLSIDPRRLYLAGFSGTARAALRFAVSLRGHVAGVVAVGGALAFELGGPETTFARDSAFGYFGSAGIGDFNYEEVLAMGDRFGNLGVPFRVAVFQGSHTWPPASICGEAVEWLELRAMRGGLRPTDSAWATARLGTELARAAELERRGQWDQAARLYTAIARDYAPWPRARLAASRSGELLMRPEVKRHRDVAKRLAEKDWKQAEQLQEALAWARSQREPPTPSAFARKLRIAELQETAAQGDSLHAASAKRLLARIFVWLSFYEPRTYLQKRAPDRALSSFETALRIGSIEGEGCRLLRTALPAANQEQRTRLRGQCLK